MVSKPVACTLVVLAILNASGCETPCRTAAALDPTPCLRAGKAFRSDGMTRIPWFELTTGEDRMVEGAVGWFDDLNNDGVRQESEPYVLCHEGEPGVSTARWRSGELGVPPTFARPTLQARAILESGEHLECTWPVLSAAGFERQ
jgi:hypothetical protein